MTNPFRDQEKFMRACDQSVGEFDEKQYSMYIKLIDEEHQELLEATLADDQVEQLDALIDILVSPLVLFIVWVQMPKALGRKL